MQEARVHTWVGKILWRRAWQPRPVFLPGESHGQRSLAGCSPWGRRESNMIDGVSSSFNTLREDSRGPRCEISFFLPVRGVTWGTES